jgi:hypothetical protein
MGKKASSVKSMRLCRWLLIVMALLGCSNSLDKTVELKQFPIDSLDGIITQSGAELDKDDSSDGNGSLRIKTKNPATVRLFEISGIEVENDRLIYQARVRSKGLVGRAYLEMRCHFPDDEEFSSVNPQGALTGTTKWATMQTLFDLKKAGRPDVIKLNLVIEGKGTVWIDDIHLMKTPRV